MPWLVNRLDPNFDAEVFFFYFFFILVHFPVAIQQISDIQFHNHTNYFTLLDT